MDRSPILNRVLIPHGQITYSKQIIDSLWTDSSLIPNGQMIYSQQITDSPWTDHLFSPMERPAISPWTCQLFPRNRPSVPPGYIPTILYGRANYSSRPDQIFRRDRPTFPQRQTNNSPEKDKLFLKDGQPLFPMGSPIVAQEQINYLPLTNYSPGFADHSPGDRPAMPHGQTDYSRGAVQLLPMKFTHLYHTPATTEPRKGPTQ